MLLNYFGDFMGPLALFQFEFPQQNGCSRSRVSSGPTGALGHCAVRFTLTGARSPLDLLGGDSAKGKGEEKWGRRFLCLVECWGCLSSEDPGEEGLHVEHWVFSQFLCDVDRLQCSLVCGVQFCQHHLLRGLLFPQCMFLALFLWINWPHNRRFIFWVSVLFLWCACLFLCQLHTFWWL